MGRAGRFGTKGLAITFVASEEDSKVLNTVSKAWLVLCSLDRHQTACEALVIKSNSASTYRPGCCCKVSVFIAVHQISKNFFWLQSVFISVSVRECMCRFKRGLTWTSQLCQTTLTRSCIVMTSSGRLQSLFCTIVNFGVAMYWIS